MSKTHRAGDVIEFQCVKYTAQLAGVRFKLDEYISVVLFRVWDEREKRREGGPWGWEGMTSIYTGYTAHKIKSIAASIADSQTGRTIWKRGNK